MNEVFKSRKLYGGYISIPDFVVKYARRTHKKVRAEFEGQYMLISPDDKYEVTAPNQTAHRTDKYIKKGQIYTLWDFWWSPVDEVKPTDWTMGGLSKLVEAYRKMKAPKQMDLTK